MSHKYLAVIPAALALVLAGCGGGSDDPAESSGMDGKETETKVYTDNSCVAEKGAGYTATADGRGCTPPPSEEPPMMSDANGLLPDGVTRVNLRAPAANLIADDRGTRREADILAFGKTDSPVTWTTALKASKRPIFKTLGNGMTGSNNVTTDYAVPISGNAATRKVGTIPVNNIYTPQDISPKNGFGTDAVGASFNLVAAITLDDPTTTGPGNDEFDFALTIPKDPNRGITYKLNGIPGKLICGASGCGTTPSVARTANAEGTYDVNVTFAGDWFFVPDAAEQDKEWVPNPKASGQYVERGTGGTYFAEWGYWLGGTGAERTLQRYWESKGGPPEVMSFKDYNEKNGGKTAGRLPNDGNTATYTGSAFGVSSTKDDDGKQTGVASFEATASLTATFGTSPTLKGTITDFAGAAVNDAWELNLLQGVISLSTTTSQSHEASGATRGGDAAKRGHWAAEVYGEADKRPAGVVGGFTGHFTDGDASGVFHAEAE